MATSLETVESELKQLREERDEVERKIKVLEEARAILANFHKPVTNIGELMQNLLEHADVGITDAVRGAFRMNSPKLLTASQVRDIVRRHGFDFSQYRNPMSNIHQVISRLIKSKELEGPLPQGNEKVYKWIGSKK